MAVSRAVSRSGSGFVLHLSRDERTVVVSLLGELREMLSSPTAPPALERLFPVVHPDDPAREAEYQRLMREELVTSRLAGIETVTAVLERPGRKVQLDGDELLAFVQAVNSIRLVLGTVLDVTEDDELDPPDELAESAEYHLYGYLSWVLDSAVRAMSADLPG
jgi:hypothetical protein